MSYGENGGLSAAEALMLNGNNRNGLFGDDLIGLIALAAVFGGGFGGGIFGGGWGGGGAGLQGIVTRADINEGFALDNILGGIQSIQQGIRDSTYAITGTVTNGFHGVERSMWDISRQLGDCCCENRAAISDVKYTIGQQGCETRNAMYINTRDIIDNQNANYRGIMDFMVQSKMDALRSENEALRLRASQADQNAVLRAAIDASTAEIIRRTGNECPIPAYVVPNPNCCYGNPVGVGYGGNGGCGCGC